MNDALDKLAGEIDSAASRGDVERLSELSVACREALETATGTDRVILRYFEANTYGAMADAKRADPAYAWSWQQPEIVSQVLALRRAVADPAFPDLDVLRQGQIRTNLGNQLNSLGRFVEALEQWDEALDLAPNFAMASGNKGVALLSYAQHLYDDGHAGILTSEANNALAVAIADDAFWDSGPHPEARTHFRDKHDETSQLLDAIAFDHDFDLDQWSLGDTDRERRFREWCLRETLFLSPLNDVIAQSAAAQDVLHLPSHRYAVDEHPRFPNYYNLLKQEFVSARMWLFEAIDGDDAHFADQNVLLLDGFDGVRFGHRAEHLRAAFRSTYSLFDKIGLFLKDYFSIDIAPNMVNFRSVWVKKNKRTKQFELRDRFADNQNWPLRGLYFLSKDLFDPEFKEVASPDARNLAKIRNQLEHRFLSLQRNIADATDTDIHAYLTIDEFAAKTLRLVKMARAALIYLSLSMHREESLRAAERDAADKPISVPIPSVPIDPDWTDPDAEPR